MFRVHAIFSLLFCSSFHRCPGFFVGHRAHARLRTCCERFRCARSDVKKSWVQESMTSWVEWKIVMQVGGLDIHIYTTLPLVIRLSWLPLANLGRCDRHRSGLPTVVTFTCQKRHLGMGITDSSDPEYDHVMVGITASLHITSLPLLHPQLFWKQQLKAYRGFKGSWPNQNIHNAKKTSTSLGPFHHIPLSGCIPAIPYGLLMVLTMQEKGDTESMIHKNFYQFLYLPYDIGWARIFARGDVSSYYAWAKEVQNPLNHMVVMVLMFFSQCFRDLM